MFDDRRPRRRLARSSLSSVILVALVVTACGGALVPTSGGSEDIDVFNQFVATYQFTD